MPRTYRLVVGAAEAEVRLDRYLVRHLPQALSRAVVQRAIDAGAVAVEGRRAKAHQHLKAGQAVTATFSQLGAAPAKLALRPEPIPLAIAYEDQDVLVVDKPPGLVTHPAPGHWSGTLVNGVLWHLKSGDQLPRAGIVHRLDKDTSGLLIIAKTAAALQVLTRQMKARAIRRRYLALVKGAVAFEEGTVDAAIGRHLKDRTLMAIRYLGGRRAVSHYRVLKRFERQGPLPFPYTLLEVTLETGRTHQIRVHMAHLGHPVLGDAVYSGHPASFWTAHGIARQLLHAAAIRFQHPTRSTTVELNAPLPEDIACWI